jgi:AraC-like DNA-binding protein/ligand-binding sensor protein
MSINLRDADATMTEAIARLKSLAPILHFFHRVTGLAAHAFVAAGNDIQVVVGTGKPWYACNLLKRDAVLAARCSDSDLHHLRLAHQLKRHVIYECHAGMVDIAVPILGLPVTAGVLTGQVLPRQPSPEECERLAQRLSVSDIGLAQLRRAFARTRFLPEDRIEAAAKLAVDLVQYAFRPDAGSDLAPLRSYVASELLRGQEWQELQGIARMVGVGSVPRVVVVVQVLAPGWREVIDWQGLNRAREVLARVLPGSLAVVERDKLVVLCSDLDRLEGRIREVLAALRAAGLRVTIGVGRPCGPERPVSESYHEAQMALGYRALTSEPVVFLDAVERPGRSSQVISSALSNLRRLIRLRDRARAKETMRALLLDLRRETSISWVLDCAVEILATIIRELRDVGNKSRALPGVLRHFVTGANRAEDLHAILALLETDATRIIDQIEGARPPTADLVQEVCEYLRRHLDEPVSLGRLCREVLFVSPDHFSRVLRRVSGMRFRQWLLAQRIARAKELLATTTHSVAVVGSHCGFAHQAHFCRAFRKATGLPPSRYRMAHAAAATAAEAPGGMSEK